MFPHTSADCTRYEDSLDRVYYYLSLRYPHIPGYDLHRMMIEQPALVNELLDKISACDNGTESSQAAAHHKAIYTSSVYGQNHETYPTPDAECHTSNIMKDWGMSMGGYNDGDGAELQPPVLHHHHKDQQVVSTHEQSVGNAESYSGFVLPSSHSLSGSQYVERTPAHRLDIIYEGPQVLPHSQSYTPEFPPQYGQALGGYGNYNDAVAPLTPSYPLRPVDSQTTIAEYQQNTGSNVASYGAPRCLQAQLPSHISHGIASGSSVYQQTNTVLSPSSGTVARPVSLPMPGYQGTQVSYDRALNSQQNPHFYAAPNSNGYVLAVPRETNAQSIGGNSRHSQQGIIDDGSGPSHIPSNRPSMSSGLHNLTSQQLFQQSPTTADNDDPEEEEYGQYSPSYSKKKSFSKTHVNGVERKKANYAAGDRFGHRGPYSVLFNADAKAYLRASAEAQLARGVKPDTSISALLAHAHHLQLPLEQATTNKIKANLRQHIKRAKKVDKRREVMEQQLGRKIERKVPKKK